MDNQRFTANRVFQLQSHSLDHELGNTLDQLTDGLEITSLSEEFKVVMRLYLFISYLKKNATTGMQVYNMQFCDTKNETSCPSKQKLIMMTATELCGTYIAKRSRQVEQFINDKLAGKRNLSWLSLDNISMLYRSFSVINFLVFLRAGKYPTLLERLLGISSTLTESDHYRNMTINKVQSDFLYREAIWKATAEFLSTLIPLINTEQLKNQALKLTGLMPKMDKQVRLSDQIQRGANASKCGICGKQPFNAHEIGCRHVFCYYCLYGKHLADPNQGFACSLCKFITKSPSEVRQYRVFLAPT